MKTSTQLSTAIELFYKQYEKLLYFCFYIDESNVAYLMTDVINVIFIDSEGIRNERIHKASKQISPSLNI